MKPYSSIGSNLGGMHGHNVNMIKAMQLHNTRVRRTRWKIGGGKAQYE